MNRNVTSLQTYTQLQWRWWPPPNTEIKSEKEKSNPGKKELISLPTCQARDHARERVLTRRELEDVVPETEEEVATCAKLKATTQPPQRHSTLRCHLNHSLFVTSSVASSDTRLGREMSFLSTLWFLFIALSSNPSPHIRFSAAYHHHLSYQFEGKSDIVTPPRPPSFRLYGPTAFLSNASILSGSSSHSSFTI